MKKIDKPREQEQKPPEKKVATYLVQGMDCPACALTIENGVRKLDGVESVDIHFSSRKLKVTGELNAEKVFKRVRELGYEISSEKPVHDRAQQAQRVRFVEYVLQREDARLFLIGLLFILPGLILNELLGQEHFLLQLSSTVALIAAGFPVFRSAFQSLRISREININVLMSIAAIGAVFIGALTEAGMVMVLFLLGEIIEGYTGERTRDAIRSLMNLVPQQASKIIRENGSFRTVTIPVSDLKVSDQILVKPGEKIPMDGNILEGVTTVDQSSITGESRPIEKIPSSDVFASSINGEGAIVVEVTHLVEDNTISRLIQMVEEAQDKKSGAQRFVDRFARIYTPIVVAVAVLVAVIPPIFFNQPFLNTAPGVHGWLYRGLALLVVGCPCALVISTPVSIISAISNAARSGLFIKGGVYLEELNRIKAFAFDKTGTLTVGKPKVVAMRSTQCTAPKETVSLSGHDFGLVQDHLKRCESCAELLLAAGALEKYSEHPLASAIVLLAGQAHRLDQFQAKNVKAILGRGISGSVNGSEIVIGSHRYFDENFLHPDEDCEAARLDAVKGLTPLMVEKDGRYLGTLILGDVTRDSSVEALRQLREAGIESLIMLTGDEIEVARGIAADLGIDEFHAQLLPEDKVHAVRELQHRYDRIVMVGDGINDAPALAAADVGIAMSTALGGTAQAMETGNITLMNDNLNRLGFLIRLSKATMSLVYFNVAFSILIKLLFFILVIAGIGTMWMAVFADMGTTLLVTLNGMRLLRKPSPYED